MPARNVSYDTTQPGIPTMRCKACGYIGMPQLGRAMGKHTIQLVCTACGQVMKTVPSILVQQPIVSAGKGR